MSEKRQSLITPDTVKYGLILAGVLVTVNAVKGLTTNLPGSDKPKPEDTKYIKDKYEQHKDLILALKINQKNLSFDRNTYKKVAQLQYDAMNGIGTTVKTLFDSLKDMNTDDLKTVFMDFGLRAPTTGFGVFQFATGKREDLIDWYYGDLSGKNLDKMRDIWRPTGLMK